MMKSKSVYAYFGCMALLLTIVSFSAANISAQDKAEKQANRTREFCSDDNYSASSDEKVSFKEAREVTVPAASLLTVDGERNGGVRVIGDGNRSDVLIRSCVQTRGASSEESRALARSIRIVTDGLNVRAERAGGEGAALESNWAVSYEILVPRSTNLKLSTHNGGISIDSVEGTIEFTAQNGGVNLKDVAGSVKGKTTNGGVSVALSGSGWKGAGGLDVETTNGGVRLSMPETYAAHVETGTTNGGFQSEIGGLSFDRKDRERPARISTDLNGGGATVRVVTTNGGVKITSSAGKNL